MYLYRIIKDFLFGLGGNYQVESAEFARNIAVAVATGQYLYLGDKEHGLTAFVSWWMIAPEDLQIAMNGGMPNNITSGSLMFITEAGSVHGLNDIRRELRKIGVKGVAWKRPTKKKEFAALNQKGAKHG